HTRVVGSLSAVVHEYRRAASSRNSRSDGNNSSRQLVAGAAGWNSSGSKTARSASAVPRPLCEISKCMAGEQREHTFRLTARNIDEPLSHGELAYRSASIVPPPAAT